jgi:hypothetical protein
MKANLLLNITSHEWNMRGIIPSLYNYLNDGTWMSVYPQEAPAAERMSKSTATTLGGAAEFIAEVKRGA